MKHIGIVGVSAEGAALCYKTIVSESQKVLGHNTHPEITINNPSFHKFLEAQKNKDWNRVANLILDSINKLKKSGADFAIIPANSVHFAFDLLKQKTKLPLISIVSVTVNECVQKAYKKVLVLGVGMTMSDGLYDEQLKNQDIEAVVPTKSKQERVNKIIYQELVRGKFLVKSTKWLLKLLEKYKKYGCEAAILGCTELPLVLNKKNSPIPLLDTTAILAKEAVRLSII